jgi:hypothetical protein
MTDIERLLAIEEIKRTKSRYFYHLDHRNWEGWRTDVFCADASLELLGVVEERLVGIDAIIAFVSNVTKNQVSVHHGHMPDIEITSDTTAKAIWAMEDVLKWSQPGEIGLNSLQGYGHYHETYVKTPAGWRIKTSRLERLRVETT